MALEKKNLEESFTMYGTCYIVLQNDGAVFQVGNINISAA